MTDKEAIELVKQLKDYCGSKECNECPFMDRIFYVGSCFLKRQAPYNFSIDAMEENAK